MKFWVDVGDLLYFPTPLLNCLCCVLFQRYSPLSLVVLEKLSKCKTFLVSSFVGRDDPNFSIVDCRCCLLSLIGKVWLSSVC